MMENIKLNTLKWLWDAGMLNNLHAKVPQNRLLRRPINFLLKRLDVRGTLEEKKTTFTCSSVHKFFTSLVA